MNIKWRHLKDVQFPSILSRSLTSTFFFHSPRVFRCERMNSAFFCADRAQSFFLLSLFYLLNLYSLRGFHFFLFKWASACAGLRFFPPIFVLIVVSSSSSFNVFIIHHSHFRSQLFSFFFFSTHRKYESKIAVVFQKLSSNVRITGKL